MNRLYFGDCLDVLRNEIADESVDLVYLDPPFNSSRNYNLLFQNPTGHSSNAQIEAFEDTWHWGEQAEREFRDLLSQQNTVLSELMGALRRFLGENDLMAYLTMMANRLEELKRTLRRSGCLYLHCDPTASHYLKVVLDGVFGPEHFVNELIWRRSDAHSDAKQGAKHYGRVHDTLLFYRKSEDAYFSAIWKPLPESTVANWYRNVEPETGRRFNKADVTGPGGAAKGNPHYEWKGITRFWRYSQIKMAQLEAEGKLVYSKSGMPYEKRYLDESKGVPVQDIWDDISMLRGISQSGERLGYPTQKPLALLERVILTSAPEGGLVLDPFCGCGTAVHAAQKLGRQWIGIDITHLAISLIEKRLHDAFPGTEFEVHGTPKDLEGARELASRDKYQFQWWACSLVGAQPWQDKKKGADRGIDGIIYFQDEKGIPKKIIVSVKGGETVGRAMIADLKNSVEREKAQIGLFVTLTSPTKEMTKEALTAGFYESPNFKSGDYPKIQILTIEGLLTGTLRPRYPDLSQGAYTFKRATQELEAAQRAEDLFHLEKG
jgi:DNA modification methylase